MSISWNMMSWHGEQFKEMVNQKTSLLNLLLWSAKQTAKSNFIISTVFENHPKCLIWCFVFFLYIFLSFLKLTCLVTPDPQVSGYQKLAKSTIFVIEWDIFCEFQTSCISPNAIEIAIQTQTVNLMFGIKMIDFDSIKWFCKILTTPKIEVKKLKFSLFLKWFINSEAVALPQAQIVGIHSRVDLCLWTSLTFKWSPRASI